MADAPARQGSSPLIGLCLAGFALLGFAVAAPWIVRRFEYAVFVPAHRDAAATTGQWSFRYSRRSAR